MAKSIINFQGKDYNYDDVTGKMTLLIAPEITNEVPISGTSVSIREEKRGGKMRISFHRKTDTIDGSTAYLECLPEELNDLKLALVSSFGSL